MVKQIEISLVSLYTVISVLLTKNKKVFFNYKIFQIEHKTAVLGLKNVVSGLRQGVIFISSKKHIFLKTQMEPFKIF